MVTGVRRRKQTRDRFPRQFQKWCQQQPKSVIISHWPALQKQKCRMPAGAEVQAGVGWGAKPFSGRRGWGHLVPHPGSTGAALAPPGTPHTSSCTLSDGRLIGDPASTTSQAAWPAARTLWDPSCPLAPLSVGTRFGWHALAAGPGGWMTGSNGRVPAFQSPWGTQPLSPKCPASRVI